jgi:hypothetical protein
MGGGIKGGRLAGAQVKVEQASLFQNRDYPVVNEYRAVLGGLFARLYGLQPNRLQKVFPGARPKDLGLAYGFLGAAVAHHLARVTLARPTGAALCNGGRSDRCRSGGRLIARRLMRPHRQGRERDERNGAVENSDSLRPQTARAVIFRRQLVEFRNASHCWLRLQKPA